MKISDQIMSDSAQTKIMTESADTHPEKDNETNK